MGTTNFPSTLDTVAQLPDIGPNTNEELTPGAEHDVVHANANAAILALQAKLGADGSLAFIQRVPAHLPSPGAARMGLAAF